MINNVMRRYDKIRKKIGSGSPGPPPIAEKKKMKKKALFKTYIIEIIEVS